MLCKLVWYSVTWLNKHDYSTVFDSEVTKTVLIIDCQKSASIPPVWNVSALELDAFLHQLDLGKFYFSLVGSKLVDEHFIFEEILVVVELLELLAEGHLK